MNRIIGDGYSDEFKIPKHEHGLVSKKKRRIYRSQDIKSMYFISFQENSDPSDNVIVYVIETIDGLKGTLVSNSPEKHEYILDKFFFNKEVPLKAVKLPAVMN
jgi:hypothetical protein